MMSPTNRHHLSRHIKQLRPSALPIVPANSPILSSHHLPPSPESYFSSSELAEKHGRRHSFRVPDLPAITSQTESEESNESSVPSLSTSPSAVSDETQTTRRKRKKKKKKKNEQDIARRKSHDDQWSGYLLALAAKVADKQLREQAMAAYPNENLHEHVDHYAIDRDSEESDVEDGVGQLSIDGAGDEDDGPKHAGRKHRESGAGWEMAEMRRHQEERLQQKRYQWATESPELGRRSSVGKSVHDSGEAQKAPEMAGAAPKEITRWQKDNEMKPMQKAASPPMAGEKLQFPKCESPRTTRMDVHNYPSVKSHKDPQHSGLWTPGGGASRSNSNSGLWMGVCAASAQRIIAVPQPLKSGLLTPGVERGDPFVADGDYDQHQLPPSPPNSHEEHSIDGTLRRELTIEEELDDAFVTQVYNYLSIGFPPLARKFDEELSRITKVPMEDLRKDDFKTNAKGYVGAPEGTGTDVRGVTTGATRCERWCALRLYVREWGRQQPEMGKMEELDGGWGATARKGSWAN